MITKYIFGEIHADFLDEDDEDIATTSRQQLAEDHPKYKALKNFLDTELRHIWTETNTLKMRRALETALESNPHVKQWYDNLRPTSGLLLGEQNLFIRIVHRMETETD